MPWHTVIMCPCTHLYSVVIGHISHQMKLHSDLADVLSNHGLACKSVFLWCVILSVPAVCHVYGRGHVTIKSSKTKNHGRPPHGVMLSGHEHSGDAQEWSVCWEMQCVSECVGLPKIEKSQEVHSSSVPNMTFCSPSLSLSGPTVDICVCVTHSFSIQK